MIPIWLLLYGLEKMMALVVPTACDRVTMRLSTRRLWRGESPILSCLTGVSHPYKTAVLYAVPNYLLV